MIEIVASITLNGATGREAFAKILSEFSLIYKIIQKVIPAEQGWSIRQKIDVAYSYMYYGAQLQTQKILSAYDPALLKLIGDRISQVREANKRKRKQSLKGQQNRLSHYFRNLFNAYKFIEHSDLSKDEKRSLGQVLRAKLSNYEQALLVLNIICRLGEPWATSRLVAKYQPIKNVPENFFSFDDQFQLKGEFPEVTFEWERLSAGKSM